MKTTNTTLHLKAYTTWLGDDGIIRTKVKPQAEVTIEEAKENSIAVNSFSKNNEKFPLLIDSRNIKSITKEARDFFSMNNRESCIVAFAVIIDSPVSRIVGNFFMGLNKPRVPAKLFNSEEDAVHWLKEFME